MVSSSASNNNSSTSSSTISSSSSSITSGNGRGRFYGKDGFNPFLHITQMISLQFVFWTSLSLFPILWQSIFLGESWYFGLVFETFSFSAFTSIGWMHIFNGFFSAIITAFGVSIIVGRLKKSVDFIFTVYFFHMLACSLWHGNIPDNGTWWTIQILTFLVSATLGEYLCLRKEATEILLAEKEERKNQTNIVTSSSSSITNNNNAVQLMTRTNDTSIEISSLSSNPSTNLPYTPQRPQRTTNESMYASTFSNTTRDGRLQSPYASSNQQLRGIFAGGGTHRYAPIPQETLTLGGKTERIRQPITPFSPFPTTQSRL